MQVVVESHTPTSQVQPGWRGKKREKRERQREGTYLCIYKCICNMLLDYLRQCYIVLYSTYYCLHILYNILILYI